MGEEEWTTVRHRHNHALQPESNWGRNLRDRVDVLIVCQEALLTVRANKHTPLNLSNATLRQPQFPEQGEHRPDLHDNGVVAHPLLLSLILHTL